MLKWILIFFLWSLSFMASSSFVISGTKPIEGTLESVEEQIKLYTGKLFAPSGFERLKAIQKLSIRPFLNSDQYDRLIQLAVFDPYDRVRIAALRVLQKYQTTLDVQNIRLLESNLSTHSLEVRRHTYAVLSDYRNSYGNSYSAEIQNTLRETINKGLLKDQFFKQYYHEVKKLSHPKWYVRLMGIQTLGRKQSTLPTELIRILAEFVLDPSLIIRLKTLKILSRFKPLLEPNVVDLVVQRKIIGALFDSNLQVRKAALNTLKKLNYWISDVRATKELSLALMDSSSHIQMGIMSLLEKLVKSRDLVIMDYLVINHGKTTQSRESYEKHTIMDYMSQLVTNSPHQDIRIEALRVLGVFGKVVVLNYDIQKIVVNGLYDSFYSVRLAAIRSLFTMGHLHPVLQDTIHPLLNDSSEEVRDIAHQILYTRKQNKASHTEVSEKVSGETCKKVF